MIRPQASRSNPGPNPMIAFSLKPSIATRIALGVTLVCGVAGGCSAPNTCPPYPQQYPGYPTYPGQQQPVYGMPTAAAPPVAGAPAGMPPGTIPMNGQPPVYSQPIPGGFPAYPSAAAPPPGYGQPAGVPRP